MGSGTSARKLILIIDDDKIWRYTISQFFSLNGWVAAAAASCAEGLRIAETTRPDCILLDFHMPDGDGGAVCSAVRASASLRRTPVIIVSADAEEELNAYGLYHADGFILKGARLEKILAVAEGALRRIELDRGCLEKGDLKLDPQGCLVFRKGRQAAALTPEQFRLLTVLIEASPEAVGEPEIFRRVLDLDYNPEKSEAVYSLIYRLRRSLGPSLARRIKNVSGRGWACSQPRVRLAAMSKISSAIHSPEVKPGIN